MNNSFGTHSAFYYYGDEHLLVILGKYIQECITKNQLILISMEPTLREKLLVSLGLSQQQRQHIRLRSVADLVEMHQTQGNTGLQVAIENIVAEAAALGFVGVSWIGQPAFSIQETSKNEFLRLELELSDLIRDKKVALVCAYDFGDFINAQKVIDDQVVRASLKTHSHVLQQATPRLFEVAANNS